MLHPILFVSLNLFLYISSEYMFVSFFFLFTSPHLIHSLSLVIILFYFLLLSPFLISISSAYSSTVIHLSCFFVHSHFIFQPIFFFILTHSVFFFCHTIHFHLFQIKVVLFLPKMSGKIKSRKWQRSVLRRIYHL